MDKKNIEYSGFYKDFLDGKAGLSTSGSVFSNSSCMFCEFNDVICPTWLGIIDNLCFIRPKEFDEILDFSKVSKMTFEELIMWYAVRRNRNALLDIKKEGIPDEVINNLTDKLFADKVSYYNRENKPFLLNYSYTLTKTIRAASNIIKKFIIYVEQCNPEVDKFLTSLYKGKVEVRSGDLVSALKDIPIDSTYVFSDIFKINALIKAGKLTGASILFADGFGYNYKPNQIGTNEGLLVDVDKLIEVYDFQFNAFNNFTDE